MPTHHLFPRELTNRLTREWHPVALYTVLASWMAGPGNIALWWAVAHLPEVHGVSSWAMLGALALALAALSLVLLLVLMWGPWRRAMGLMLLVVVAVGNYFMLHYGVVIDRGMVANALNTDWREVQALLDPFMLVHIALGVLLPSLWWWRQKVRPYTMARALAHRLGWAALALLLGVGMLFLAFQDLASLMRNHRELRYMISPYNTLYAALRLGQGVRLSGPLRPVGEDASLAEADGAAPVIVLVVGETARAADWQLDGYARATTPQLRQLEQSGDLINFARVTSCGTSTEASLPCMFSPLGREAFVQHEQAQENLLDVLQRAGLAVLWIDNQSGCKALCDRVTHVEMRAHPLSEACPQRQCQDTAMLDVLPQALQALDPARRARGTVVVLHQMGSHGPAYDQRAPGALKRFQPECHSAALQQCDRDAIVNSYDNSLLETDALLAQTVAWLRGQGAGAQALWYVSDHGESLGESGLYLHGMPFGLAPEEQKHVPMVAWASDGMKTRLGLDWTCLKARGEQAYSHDHLFHTMLDLAQVHTRWLTPDLSVLRPCMQGAGQRR